MDKAEIVVKVWERVAGYAGVPVESLSGQHRLWHDLKISGDDARDLLESLALEFGVSFDAFAVDTRFPAERDEGSLLFVVKRLLGAAPQYTPTTLDELLSVIVDQRSHRGLDMDGIERWTKE